MPLNKSGFCLYYIITHMPTSLFTSLFLLTLLHVTSPRLSGADFPAHLGFLDLFPKAEYDHAVWIAPFPDRSHEYLVLEQSGTAICVATQGKSDTTFLDITRAVKLPKKYTEEGLLSLAFHPQWAVNRLFFTWSTTHRAGKLQTVLTRWKADPAGLKADLASETVLITVDQPFSNHNGGSLHFGPDGMLYLGLGDGGSGGDPQENSQNMSTLLGKIIRIDVDHQAGGLAYAIPADNPFVQQADARGEIWAYGMRNPWRMSFDSTTGNLWAGDVGQDAREEVDIIVKGGNYGWNMREGFLPFKNGPLKAGMIEPVYDYDHDAGKSITGGYVYRGTAIPELIGAYIFGDYATRRIWGLRIIQGKAQVQELAKAPKGISSFGQDADGEILIVCYNGKIYRLIP